MKKNEHPSVVIIEENPERMTNVLDILKNQQVDLIPIPNCQTAIEKVTTERPDLVIMDLSSQKSRKQAIYEQMLSRSNFQHVKFLFFVPEGFSDEINIPKNQLAGTIKKPFYFGDVLGKLHATLYDTFIKQLATQV